jgi:dTDP-4-dehydrorhamnose reductase
MKILITGAHGQLGQELVRLCHSRNIPYRAADSKMLDITDQTNVNQFIRTYSPDVILNGAAYNAVDLAETEWNKAFSVNALGVKNLARAANQSGSVLVHYSTDYVFDGRSNCPYAVACTPHPLSRYGESKVLGENFVRDLCERWFLIRTSWLFGKGKKNFARKILDRSRETKKLSIVDDRVSSPTYTVDLAKATLDLVQTDSFGLYHFSNAGICSRFDWARYILQQTRWNGILHRAKSDDLKTAAQRPAYSALDTSGTEEILGYKLPSWQDATTRYLREMRGIV